MKTFIAVMVIIGVSLGVYADLTDEQKQKLQNDGKACIGETGVEVDLVEKARKGTFTDDPKLKAFTSCMAKKIGFQNAAGETQRDVVKQKLAAALNDPAAADKLIEKCLHDKSTPEDTAFENLKCYYENTPLHLSVI
nr:odorant binding protein 28 [Pachyrhinus yasumatsui]